LVSAPFPEFVYSDVGYGLSSCSAAEALDRQEPFVNPTLANHTLALLTRLFRYGSISYHGAFLGLSSIAGVQALRIDPKYWQRLRKKAQSGQKVKYVPPAPDDLSRQTDHACDRPSRSQRRKSRSPRRKDHPMEDKQPSNDQRLEPEQAAAKAAGVTFVAAHFDGSGDEGATEDVKCYDSEDYAHDEYEPTEHDASLMQEHFDAFVPYGYQNGCGGFGDVVLDVKARKITVERNNRFEDYTTTTYEI
jgi:hypothetical protein